MALTPDEFYEHALAAADNELRLSLAKMAYWDIFPFDEAGPKVAPLRPPVISEKARMGEGGVDCLSCHRSDQGIWLDDDWRLTRVDDRLTRVDDVGVPLVLMLHAWRHVDLTDLPDVLAGELGRLTVRIARAVEAIPHIARCHVYRIGDGGAHLQVWFFGRPEGQSQLYGSLLPAWDDLLPAYPADGSVGGSRSRLREPSARVFVTRPVSPAAVRDGRPERVGRRHRQGDMAPTRAGDLRRGLE